MTLLARLRQRLHEYKNREHCTGISAGWCPVHGDCVCENPDDKTDTTCPLHYRESTHGEGDDFDSEPIKRELLVALPVIVAGLEAAEKARALLKRIHRASNEDIDALLSSWPEEIR